jgi:hypothetical protein
MSCAVILSEVVLGEANDSAVEASPYLPVAPWTSKGILCGACGFVL